MSQACITDEQVRFFRDNGYLVLRSVVHGEEFSRLHSAMDRLTDYGKLGVHADPDYKYGPGHKTGRRVLRRIEYVVDKTDEAKVLLGHPFILRSVERIVGGDLIPTWDSMVLKLPSEGIEVPWHRDAGMVHVGDVPIFNVDIYLERADEDTCLWVIPGSHRWNQEDADHFVSRPVFSTEGATPVLVDPGDVIFHNILLLHGSPANASTKTRRVIYFEFRTAKVESAKGPHVPEYIPLKQRVLLECIEKRKAAPYIPADEVPYEYDPPAPWKVPPSAEPLATYRYAHEDYWREA